MQEIIEQHRPSRSFVSHPNLIIFTSGYGNVQDFACNLMPANKPTRDITTASLIF